MARDGLAEVFDFEGAFQARGEEATKGCNEGGKCCEDEDVKLHGGDMNGGRNLEGCWAREVGEEGGDMISLMYENGVWDARETCEDVCAKVLQIG